MGKMLAGIDQDEGEVIQALAGQGTGRIKIFDGANKRSNGSVMKEK